jgi:hypothetical protein
LESFELLNDFKIKTISFQIRSTSIQCDPVPEPEPIIIHKQVNTEPPAPVQLPPPPPPPQPNSPKNITIASESDLTESTKYSSDASSTRLISSTSSDTSKSDDDENDSYFSDGAWLMSKSEGQIIPVVDQRIDCVNLDMQLVMNEMQKDVLRNEYHSEGELKIKNLNLIQNEKKQRRGFNRITQASESGEFNLNSAQMKNLNQGGEKSEGELENSKLKEKNSIKTSLNESEKIAEKKSSSLKNKIKIQSIRKFFVFVYSVKIRN